MSAFAAIDWGTSSFRAWLIGADGGVLGERRGGDGMLSAGREGFSAVLERHLAALGAPEDLPAVVCGMAGARQGWVEAPYVDVPARLDEIVEGAVTPPDARRPVKILPGLAQRAAGAPDVMRGEETQLAGLLPGIPGGTALVCMPGTHCKWVLAERGGIAQFRTWMTGELFALLSGQSILKHSIGEATARADSPAFAAAVDAALDGAVDLSSGLFRIRAATLLEGRGPEESAAALSGLLIGAEILAARRAFPERTRVVLVGAGSLGGLYETALARAGFSLQPADAENAVRRGLCEAARRLGHLRSAP